MRIVLKASKLVEHLQEAVEKLGYKIRIEQGRFHGGDCLHEDKKLVIINRRMGDEERAEVLARTLAAHENNQVFLVPEARIYVEKFVEARPSVLESSAQAAEQ